jgi:site-specific DNA recombinase
MKRAASNKLTEGFTDIWAIYARVSDPKQAEEDNESLPRQLRDCHAWLAERRLTCYGEYVDPGEEGDALHRPGLDRLRMDMRRGKFGGIICQKYDRFSRDSSITDIVLYEADEYDVDVQFVMEERHRSPLGKLEMAARGVAAELEHENIRFRTMMGTEGRAHKGKPLAGKKPLYGYR